SYAPAIIDPLLVGLESRFPGTISAYERYNDLIVEDNMRRRIARWRWIAATRPDLADHARQRAATRREQLPHPGGGYIGILVIPERDAAAWFEPVETPVLLLLQVLRFVMLLNLMVGAANLLPIKGLDGGWMLDTAVTEYLPDRAAAISRAATVGTLGIVIISFTFLAARYLV
ncbi:MAG: site-2 protease family protein, partial [Candidatus Nanohaloarchaea archaeon]